jgi:hypothetical protein
VGAVNARGEATTRGRIPFIGTSAVFLTLLAIVLGPAASSFAQAPAKLRFVHAVPGVGEATLTAGDTEVGSAAYGEATPFADVPAGSAELALEAEDGTLEASDQLQAGRSYTVIALARGQSGELRVYPDGQPKPSTARLRMIHAAPELGSPDFSLNGEVISEGATYTEATAYWDLQPGTYRAVLSNPETGDPAVPPQELPLAAGTTSTLVVLGSRGEPVKTLLLTDGTAAPAAAPQTGLGGLAEDGPSWAAALIAGLLAGCAGGAAYLVMARRRGRTAARGH